MIYLLIFSILFWGAIIALGVLAIAIRFVLLFVLVLLILAYAHDSRDRKPRR